MATLQVYLNFKGNTEEVFNFYKSIFGGEFSGVHRYKDMPDTDKLSPVDLEKLMNIALPIGDVTLMGSDLPESMQDSFIAGNNFSITYNAKNREDADKVFTGLAAGGNIKMPLMKTFWSPYFGMLTDKYNINWMVNIAAPVNS